MTNCKNCGHLKETHYDLYDVGSIQCHMAGCKCERFEP